MRGFLHKVLPLLAVLLGPAASFAGTPAHDGYLVASDGVRLHYFEAGPPAAPTLVFVPGWTMPAWIWQPQIAAFSPRFHVVAFDPRGQGGSEIAPDGYDAARRGQDIAELIAHVSRRPVLLVGWSLGVLDSLAYVAGHGDAALAGLVLVDNSVGEAPAPAPAPHHAPRRGPVPREVWMRGFVRGMFRRPPGGDYLDRLTEAALRTPKAAADALLAYGEPRSYWRDALYEVRRPVLYAITPRWSAQAANVAARDPYAEIATFPDAGHALFIDDAARFDAVLADFIRRRVFP